MIGKPEYISSGFSKQIIFSELASLPIHFVGNTVFASYSIAPSIGSGLSFNETTGVISGTYTGNRAAVTYQVTGTNSFGSVFTSFTLDYRSGSDGGL